MSNQNWEQVQARLRGLATSLQSRATSPTEGKTYRQINSVGDDNQRSRQVKSVLFVVLPLVLCLYVFASWLSSCGAPPKASAQAVTPAPKSAVVVSTPAPGQTVTKFGGSLFDAGMQSDNKFTYGMATVAPLKVGAPAVVGVKCYARENSHALYSDDLVLSQSLFIAEKYTRVKGGLIYSPKFGWHIAGLFGCAGNLDSIEVEWIEPKPTATRVIPVTRVPTKVPTAIPVLPSPTLASGLISASGSSCDSVSWLAWQVSTVYLIYGGRRVGVAGDSNGQAVIQSVCPYTGTVRIETVNRDGTRSSRELEIR